MRILYLPLEPYGERYTELLAKWAIDYFSALPGTELVVISGDKLNDDGVIRTGSVLDAHARSYWSATQIAKLVRELHDGAPADVIYLDDLFTPGFEAIPYILSQVSPYRRPRVYARNHAQSVDPDDFTYPMRRWMRPYEQMVYSACSGVLCSSTAHEEMMRISLQTDLASVHVVGHGWDATDVRSRGPAVVPPLSTRKNKVVYCSRIDTEKNPQFLLALIESGRLCGELVICTGAKQLHSNADGVVAKLEQLEARGRVRIERGCTKASYYAELATASVQLNVARQDFVSYTALEASAFGTPTLAPAFRSFPEALRNDEQHLFVPWSLEDAIVKLNTLLNYPDDEADYGWLSRAHQGTFGRMLRVFEGRPFLPWWEEP